MGRRFVIDGLHSPKRLKAFKKIKLKVKNPLSLLWFLNRINERLLFNSSTRVLNSFLSWIVDLAFGTQGFPKLDIEFAVKS